MPVKYRIKEYKSDSYYHIYNRGLDGREVFSDAKDYEKYVGILRGYVNGGPEDRESIYKVDRPSVRLRKQEMSLTGEVSLAAYCLMPDHVHLVVWQKTRDGITRLMRRLNTAYVMYFNGKHGRHGPLFETVYRAALVAPVRLPGLTRYLHVHPVAQTARRYGPVVTVSATRPEDYEYSSYKQYIGLEQDKWIDNWFIKLTPESYQKYMDEPQIEGSAIEGTEPFD